MKNFVESDAGARQLDEHYCETAASQEARQAYHYLVMAVLRERSMMQGAWEEGWEEGLEKGMKEGLEEVRKEIAIKAIAMKIPTSQIERLTGLTRAEIEDLRR